MWLQGIDEAPKVVRACVASWQRENPTWEVIVLDRARLAQYVNLDQIFGNKLERITPQALSDIIRINLLADHGGVWADATCYCSTPLDDWIHAYLDTGFFAFSNPKPDRMIASWFLASVPGSKLTSEYRRITNDYWLENDFSRQGTETGKKIVKRLSKLLNHKNTVLPRFWFSIIVRRILRVHPYFWFHYGFAELLSRNPECCSLWRTAPKFDAAIPLELDRYGLFNRFDTAARTLVEESESPLWKLTWKYREDQLTEDCVLNRLISSNLL